MLAFGVDFFPQLEMLERFLIALIEVCSALILVNSSLTVIFSGTQEWLKKTFTIPLFSGILFLTLVVFQTLGVSGFSTLQPSTAFLFALYSVFVFLLSWNIHNRAGPS